MAQIRKKRRPVPELPSQNRLLDLLAAPDVVLPVVTYDWSSHLRKHTRRLEVFAPENAPIMFDLLVKDPEPPRYVVDTSRPIGWNTATPDAVAISSADLVTKFAAVDQNVGHTYVIELVAGLTFNTATSYRPPNKTGPNEVVVRTSNYANLPASGTRVGPSNAVNMPKIVTSGVNVPALRFNESSHDYHFIGIEVTSTVTQAQSIITLGVADADGSEATSLSQLPTRIVFDQCYVHGTPSLDVRRGIAGNGSYVGVVDSYISDFHSAGFDSQAFAVWNGNGPIKLDNSYFEASGENVMFGGSRAAIANATPSDIYVTHCYFNKPLTWKSDDPSYAGIHWTVKNSFELKNAQRVWIEGCVFENCWGGSGQAGFAIVFTPRNEGSGSLNPWTVVQDVRFTNNIVRKTGSGFNILNGDQTGAGGRSLPMRRVLINNNLIQVDKVTYIGSGHIFQFAEGSNGEGRNISLIHNTCIHNPTNGADFIYIGDNHVSNYSDGSIIRDNLTTAGNYGITGSPALSGKAVLDYWLANYICDHNAIIKNGAAITDAAYPAGNFFPLTNAAVGFTDSGGGNFSLTSSSPYHNAASDGTDIGVNWATLQAAISGVATGGEPPPSVGPPFHPVGPGGGFVGPSGFVGRR